MIIWNDKFTENAKGVVRMSSCQTVAEQWKNRAKVVNIKYTKYGNCGYFFSHRI